MAFRRIESNSTPLDVDGTLVTRYTGIAGDVGLIAATGFSRNKLDTFFQSDSPVNLFFTLDSPAEAINPTAAIQAGVSWDGPYACTKVITNFNKQFSAFKVVFTAEAILNVATVKP